MSAWSACPTPASRPSWRPSSNARPKIADYPFTTLHPAARRGAASATQRVRARRHPRPDRGRAEGAGLGTASSAMSSAAACCCTWSTAPQDDVAARLPHGARRADGLWRQSGAQEGDRGAQQDRRHDAGEDIEAKRARARQGRAARPVHVHLGRVRPGRARPAAARADEAASTTQRAPDAPRKPA